MISVYFPPKIRPHPMRAPQGPPAPSRVPPGPPRQPPGSLQIPPGPPRVPQKSKSMKSELKYVQNSYYGLRLGESGALASV